MEPENTTSRLKNLTFLVLPYLGVCAILYHLAYWSTFNINALSYLSLSNILVSSIYPIVTSVASSFLGIIASYLFPQKKTSREGEQNTIFDKIRDSKSAIILLIALWLFLIIYIHRNGHVERWFMWTYLVAIVPYFYIEQNTLIPYIKDDRTRLFFTWMLILLPIFSYSTGKYNSEKIFRNISFRYTLKNEQKLKYLGHTEGHVVLSTLNNDCIILLRSDAQDSIYLFNK